MLSYADWVIFSDLDGTLLDHDTYCMEAARPQVERLAHLRIPLIVASSKTLAEVRALALPGPPQPLILESGAVLAVPEHYFPGFDGDGCEDGYRLVCYSPPRERILRLLGELREMGFAFDGFADWGDEGIARRTGLSSAQARLARQRRGSEPILWQESPRRRADFEQALAERGLRLDEGGRFLHVLGVGADKGRAMRGLLGLYRLHDWPVRATMALGDSPNDLGMLHNADRPVVVRHPDGSWLDAASVPRAVYTRGIGPHGWHEAVGQLLGEMGERG